MCRGRPSLCALCALLVAGRATWAAAVSHAPPPPYGSTPSYAAHSHCSRALSADVPEWVPSAWRAGSHFEEASHNLYEYSGHRTPGDHAHYAPYFSGGGAGAPPPEVAAAGPRVFVTRGGREIEFLDTAVNVPRRH